MYKGQLLCQRYKTEKLADNYTSLQFISKILVLFLQILVHYLKKSYPMKRMLLMSSLFLSALVNAQTKTDPHTRASKWHYASQFDGSIFSSAITSGAYAGDPIIRYAPFFNIGHTIHNEFNNLTGAIIGIGIKNIGFIEKRGDTTFKKRVYAFGVNAALKFGDMKTNRFVFLGAGLDLPFNYKEKQFVNRSDKRKSSEWFSTATPQFLPNVFIGFVRKSFSVKLQYYPVNFLNENNAKYKEEKVNLILLSFGHDFRFFVDKSNPNKKHLEFEM